MIEDNGNPSTLSGSETIDEYLKQNCFDVKELPKRDVNMIYQFGETKLLSKECVDIPVKIKVLNEEGTPSFHVTSIPTYRVQGKVPYLLGTNTFKSWNAKTDIQSKQIEMPDDNGSVAMKITTPKTAT